MNAPRLQMETRSGNNSRTTKVLLLGDLSVTSYFRSVLERRRCQCSLGDRAGLDPKDFDLILIAAPIEDEEQLVSRLKGSNCAVFTCQPDDDGGFLWVPLMLEGAKCTNVNALTPTEFIAYLDRIEASRSQAAE